MVGTAADHAFLSCWAVVQAQDPLRPTTPESNYEAAGLSVLLKTCLPLWATHVWSIPARAESPRSPYHTHHADQDWRILKCTACLAAFLQPTLWRTSEADTL